MTVDPKLVVARRDADAARERLLRSAHVLQARIAPSRVMNDAVESARERGTALVNDVGGAARKRPGVAASIAVGAVLFLFRRPIGRLFGLGRRPDRAATRKERREAAREQD